MSSHRAAPPSRVQPSLPGLQVRCLVFRSSKKGIIAPAQASETASYRCKPVVVTAAATASALLAFSI